MPRGVIQFDEFALDCDRYELLRAGLRVKLEKLPMELLILLVEKGGHLVTRQEIVERLWGPGVFLDTEHGINTAIRKIRAALREDADEPRFVQTVVGKGYRFVAEHATEKASAPETLPEPKRAEPADVAAPQRHRPWLALALILFLVGAGVLALKLRAVRNGNAAGARPAIRSIAVLPLANLSGDASQDYFADGMTDELITTLTKNTLLRVVSRTSVMRYKGVSRPMHEIARELGADGILEGSILRSANRLHLTVQLVQGANDAHIWAQSYDRDLSDALSLLSELSSTIAREVNVATSQPTQPHKSINPEAHSVYLRGRDRWFNGDYGRAQDFYQKAIQLQPAYAAAWSGLADAYAGLAMDGNLPSREFREEALAAARKGLQLDDTLVEAHHSMAGVQYFLEWDWKAAEVESLRAIQLNPNFSEAHHLRSYILHTLNRPQEALQEQKLASELDPDLRPWALGRMLMHLRQFDAAVKELHAREQEHPHSIHLRYILADAYHFAGMAKESVHEYQEIYRSDNDIEAVEAVQREFQHGGEHAVIVWRLNRWKKIVARSYADPYILAAKCARAGRIEEALAALENAYRLRSAGMPWLQFEPDFDSLHSEPRYQAIIRKMNLPPAQ